MRYIKADLLSDVVSSYDQTKTTIQGRIASKTVDSQSVLGPPLNKFIDTFTDTTPSSVVTPILSYLSPNGRLFSIGAEAGGLSPLSLHTVNLTTGATSFVGTIRVRLADTAATTHTFRSLKVLDTGTTNWKIFFTTTGTVTINGGLYMANNVDLADFLAVGPGTEIPFATGNNQKATYLLQDPSNIGAGQLNIAAVGSVLDSSNNRIYVHNGIAATHQYYVYSTNTSPTWSSNAVTGSAATDIISDVGHSFVNGTPLVFNSLTGGAGLVVGTVYFVVTAVAGVSYQLSATSGGAAINFTTDITAATIGRAFGTTGSNWVHKTGNLPALTGTLITNDSEDYALPGHTANSGQPCAFLCTSTNLYLGQLVDLTSGAVTWPTLVTSNILGTANQITAPTLAQATWSTTLDKAVYLTNTNILVMKQVVNNSIDKLFGRNSNIYREAMVSPDNMGFGFNTITSLDIESGWIIATGNTVGQRGIYLADLRSDLQFDYSYIVTKVLDTTLFSFRFLSAYLKLYSDASPIQVYYRTSGFGTITGGWVALNFLQDISAIAAGTQIQFKIAFDTFRLGASVPAQLYEFILGYESNTAISDNWEFSDDFSDNAVPSRVTFRLKVAYSSSVPTLYFRAYDLSNALIVNHNTSSNPSNFEYSTDNGVSWIPLGTIPNTVGTLVRYTFTSAPGVDIRPGLKES